MVRRSRPELEVCRVRAAGEGDALTPFDPRLTPLIPLTPFVSEANLSSFPSALFPPAHRTPPWLLPTSRQPKLGVTAAENQPDASDNYFR